MGHDTFYYSGWPPDKHLSCDQNADGNVMVRAMRTRVMIGVCVYACMCVCVYGGVCARVCVAVVGRSQYENVDSRHVHLPVMHCRQSRMRPDRDDAFKAFGIYSSTLVQTYTGIDTRPHSHTETFMRTHTYIPSV